MYFQQSWALAHFFKVRYPLPTQFFPLDRWRSCVHFLNFPFRSSLKRSSLNQWFAERKRAKSLIAHWSKHGIFFSPIFLITIWPARIRFPVWIRVSPFAKTFFSLKRKKTLNWIHFTCVSLVHLKNSGQFFCIFSFQIFRFQLSYFRLEAKRRENLFFASNILSHFKKHFLHYCPS